MDCEGCVPPCQVELKVSTEEHERAYNTAVELNSELIRHCPEPHCGFVMPNEWPDIKKVAKERISHYKKIHYGA